MNKLIVQKEKKYILQTYKRYPVELVKGDGVWVWDAEGNKYLDFLAGIAVNNLGYNNKILNKVIADSSGKLIHTSNLFYTYPQIRLAEKISMLTNRGKVFFANSGAEANEAAVKLARAYGNSFAEKKSEIITLKNSFHGRTLATVFATGQTKYQKGFEPKIKSFKYVEPNNIKSFNKTVSDKTAAVMIEFIQGEGGVEPLDRNFVKNIVQVCKERDILFIADEIQTGMGRTGKMFAFQHYKILPDVITVAKAIANGLPMGLMIVKNKFAKYLSYGMHASTFGGGYLVSSVAEKVVDIISDNKFLEKVNALSEYFFDKLRILASEKKVIKRIKGKGLMIGLELNKGCSEYVLAALKRKLIINCAHDNVLRFLPPLIIVKENIDFAVEVLREIL